jgi:hypothetical protein
MNELYFEKRSKAPHSIVECSQVNSDPHVLMTTNLYRCKITRRQERAIQENKYNFQLHVATPNSLKQNLERRKKLCNNIVLILVPVLQGYLYLTHIAMDKSSKHFSREFSCLSNNTPYSCQIYKLLNTPQVSPKVPF